MLPPPVREPVMIQRLLFVSALSIALVLLAPPPGAVAAGDEPPESFPRLVKDIQGMLTELGYRPGPVDGSMGDRTRQSIRRYQSNTGLPVDGHPSADLWRHLRVTTGAAPAAPAPGTAGASKAPRKAAWQGETVADALLRIAPSGASASRRHLPKGTGLEVIRRQGTWLEVRVEGTSTEGWVKQSSVRAESRAGAAAPAPKKESGGFFANLSRGISRLLGGSREAPRDQGNVTVGIRGLAPEDLAATVPDPGELEEMEGYRADRDTAYRFAGEERLSAQTVEYLAPVAPAAEAPATRGGRD